MQKHYSGLTERMMSEIACISDQMSHPGEKGRNNEHVLGDFLRAHLPHQYTVSTGKAVAVGGNESGQMDLIVHDRANNPALIDARAWSLVPVESIQAVISVKTTLDKSELRDGIKSIASVRSLPRKAAIFSDGSSLARIEEEHVLRPRGYVFGFKADWTDPETFRAAFVETTGELADDLRPNGACVLKQATVIRKPHTLDTIQFTEHVLLHFFVHLVQAIASRPKYMVNLSAYFTEDYGLKGS